MTKIVYALIAVWVMASVTFPAHALKKYTAPDDLPGDAPNTLSKAPVLTKPIESKTPDPKKSEKLKTPALADEVLKKFEGSGMHTTRPFKVTGPWEIQWDTKEFLSIWADGPQELRFCGHTIAAPTAISSSEQKKAMETVEMTIEKARMTIEKARMLAKAAVKTGTRPAELQLAVEELAEAVLLLADEVEKLKPPRA